MLTCAAEATIPHTPSREVLKLPLRDSVDEDIRQGWGPGLEFLTKAVVRERMRVLVHCVQGRSRSATVVAAFLMAAAPTEFPTAEAALQRILAVRPQARPNLAFLTSLATFQQALHPSGEGFPASGHTFTADLFARCGGVRWLRGSWKALRLKNPEAARMVRGHEGSAPLFAGSDVVWCPALHAEAQHEDRRAEDQETDGAEEALGNES